MCVLTNRVLGVQRILVRLSA